MPVNLTAHALLFTLAAVGISEAAYLVRKRQAAEAPICPMGGGCEVVLRSKYNKMFLGIHNDAVGLFFYTLFAALAGLLVVNGLENEISRFVVFGLKVMLLAALALSAIFTYLQWRVIKAWCFWCLMSATTVLLLAIIMFSSNL